MKTRFNLIKRVMRVSALVTVSIFLSVYSNASDKPKPKEVQVKNTVTTQTLSGQWKLAVDPENKGRDEGWFNSIRPESKEAIVPGVIQQVFPAYHGVVWYWHSFSPDFSRASGDRVLIRFGAVDYLADVWINGQHAGTFEGGETPFEFDITNSLKVQGANLLAVRVLNPTDNPIDGYVLKQIPHRNKPSIARTGSAFNNGGIMYPVELRLVPTTYITDVFVRPDIKTGVIGVTVAVRNSGSLSVKGILDLTVAPASSGDILQVADKQAEFPAGVSEHELTIKVSQPRLWSLDDPFLYRVTANLTSESKQSHQQSVRCGFRDFRIVDGYFYLNDKRVFLKSTHTGNSMPIGQQVSVVGDFGRRDMLYAKASGFNAVRFIAGVAYPEQLDLCDELGLMVYEECYASWCLENSPKMAERFDHSTSSMIRRDRNHPSVTIWGLLNETMVTWTGPVFQEAVNFLPKVRKLDPTRMVLLNSGRFDGQWPIGSASNPGSSEWEHVWGIEGPNVPKIQEGLDHPSNEGAGDFHNYSGTPQTSQTDKFLREIGRSTKPVFLSEYGIGSQMNVINEWRHFEQVGARPDLEDGSWYREQSEAFTSDWKRLGFDNVYPFPEDMLRETMRLHARQRTLGFNCIRSNPQLCGYNLTGMLDHGMTGEGLWTLFREWKPATFDAVRDGWSTLRWCLFVEPLHAYSGRTVTVEAVLANEDVLKPGEYRAKFRVFGPNGPVWEKETLVKVPDPPVLAVPVIRETFELKGPAGQYTFAANLEEGGAPTGGELEFYVSDPATLPQCKGKVALWGIDKKAEEWLTAHGLVCHQLTTDISTQPEVVLVGKPADAETNPKMWESLSARMEKGSTVVFLSGQIFTKGTAGITWLPLKNKGTCFTFGDGLYHKECISKRHQVFDGLQGPGIMDWDYYGPVIPHEIFEGQDTPDETIAASFATGNPNYPRGYGSGLLIAMYKLGDGRMILSTPYVLENLDSHPAADRLLLNLVRYAQGQILPKEK
jgi:hypothetical protein